MSSLIKIQKICGFCKKEFMAQKTTTKYCSHICNSRAYKAKIKQDKIDNTNKETIKIISFPLEQLKAKEFLTVREVAVLLNCSVRCVYYCIEVNKLKAVNLRQRITRVKRSEIDKLFC